jgi:hypothetical protein
VFENPIGELVHKGLLGSLDDLVIPLGAVLHTGEARNGFGSIHQHSSSIHRSRLDRRPAARWIEY